jgi:subtilisin family serine protease
VSVGAINSNLKRCSFSNYGPNLDFVAPGDKIISLKPDNKYVAHSGTSMACPHVAATAALYMSKSGITSPSLVYKALKESAISIGSNSENGHGLINVGKVVTNAKIKENNLFQRNLLQDRFPLIFNLLLNRFSFL